MNRTLETLQILDKQASTYLKEICKNRKLVLIYTTQITEWVLILEDTDLEDENTFKEVQEITESLEKAHDTLGKVERLVRFYEQELEAVMIRIEYLRNIEHLSFSEIKAKFFPKNR